MEHKIAVSEKEGWPHLAIPHLGQKEEVEVEKKAASKVSEDKNFAVKGKSTSQAEDSKMVASKHKTLKLSSASADAKEEIKGEVSNAKSAKTDLHTPKETSKSIHGSHTADTKEETKDEISHANGDEHAPEASQHPQESMFVEREVTVSEKEGWPHLAIPHLGQKEEVEVEKKAASK